MVSFNTLRKQKTRGIFRAYKTVHCLEMGKMESGYGAVMNSTSIFRYINISNVDVSRQGHIEHESNCISSLVGQQMQENK